MELRYGVIDNELLAILPDLMALNSSKYSSLLLRFSKSELLDYFNSASK
jgi:hypothetical protein